MTPYSNLKSDEKLREDRGNIIQCHGLWGRVSSTSSCLHVEASLGERPGCSDVSFFFIYFLEPRWNRKLLWSTTSSAMQQFTREQPSLSTCSWRPWRRNKKCFRVKRNSKKHIPPLFTWFSRGGKTQAENRPRASRDSDEVQSSARHFWSFTARRFCERVCREPPRIDSKRKYLHPWSVKLVQIGRVTFHQHAELTTS